eukprot:jgi/Bigna1/77067/fgenesh1_pg.45_\
MSSKYGASLVPEGMTQEEQDELAKTTNSEEKVKVTSEHGSRYGAQDLGFGPTNDDEEFEGGDGIDIDSYNASLGDVYGTDAYGAAQGETYGALTNPDDLKVAGSGSRYGAQDAPEDEEERKMRMKIKRKEETKYEKSLKQSLNLTSIFDDRQVVEMKDWSSSFLEAEELPERTAHEVLVKYKTLTKLSTDFIEIAKAYGRTAITEYFLHEKRTVKKHKLGGVAGGDKYLVRGILFKLAVDPPMGKSNWIYGGSKRNLEYAAKAAGHELKGAINMYKYHVKKIRVPMQALVDFHGYRIVAMPLLPLKKMIYGSKDAGKIIHRSDEKFNKIMEEIADDLHLAGHYICDQNGHPNLLHAAGDIEGHLGKDNRYYLLDLARAFPPESVWDTAHLNRPSQAVFFRMLRPEFLQYLKENGHPPLSCDALTNWGQSYTDRHEHNDRLRKATRILVEKLIPAFAEE